MEMEFEQTQQIALIVEWFLNHTIQKQKRRKNLKDKAVKLTNIIIDHQKLKKVNY
jgi:hypothetical protein